MKQIKPCIFLLLLLFCPIISFADLTIQQCVEKAEKNYPLIRKYNILTALKDIELSDINKSWLPHVEPYAQATVQNVVPSYPDALKNVLQQMGNDVRGLGKSQYKIGVDLSQTIWDGGASKIRRELADAQEEVNKNSIDVELYAVRERVENLYFAILLTEEQILQNGITYNLLIANKDKLSAMLRNGVAMRSDVEMVEAQALTLKQNIAIAKSHVAGYRDMLALYVGESLDDVRLATPGVEMPKSDSIERPELRLFDRRLKLNSLSDKLTDVALMPKIGFFAQAYYGYPGFDYFKSMMSRNLSFNVMAGVKISWNIDSFYTKKNNYRKTALNSENILADKDIFLFNVNLQTSSQKEKIEGLRNIMKDNSRIVDLRSGVRKAAESQLENGVIDATALLAKISDENLAKLNAKFHEIQLIQEIYKLRYLLNL